MFVAFSVDAYLLLKRVPRNDLFCNYDAHLNMSAFYPFCTILQTKAVPRFKPQAAILVQSDFANFGQRTIFMNYHALFVIFEKAATVEIVVCCKLWVALYVLKYSPGIFENTSEIFTVQGTCEE